MLVCVLSSSWLCSVLVHFGSVPSVQLSSPHFIQLNAVQCSVQCPVQCSPVQSSTVRPGSVLFFVYFCFGPCVFRPSGNKSSSRNRTPGSQYFCSVCGTVLWRWGGRSRKRCQAIRAGEERQLPNTGARAEDGCPSNGGGKYDEHTETKADESAT